MSEKKERMRSGVPPSVAPRFAVSNTQTSAREMLGDVIWGSPAPVTPAIEASVRCWPRCAVVMNARESPVPAKTMSRGSSPTSSVRTTRAGEAVTSTMLTLSERWLTTQTIPLGAAATAAGSNAHRHRSNGVRPLVQSTSKISSRLPGMLTA